MLKKRLVSFALVAAILCGSFGLNVKAESTPNIDFSSKAHLYGIVNLEGTVGKYSVYLTGSEAGAATSAKYSVGKSDKKYDNLTNIKGETKMSKGSISQTFNKCKNTYANIAVYGTVDKKKVTKKAASHR